MWRNPIPGSSERRRSPRLPLAMPVELAWTARDGARVRERAVTENVSAQGALVRVSGTLPTSQEVQIRHPLTGLSARAEVVRTSGSAGDGKGRLALRVTQGRVFSAFLLLLCLFLGGPSSRAGDPYPTPASSSAAIERSTPAAAHTETATITSEVEARGEAGTTPMASVVAHASPSPEAAFAAANVAPRPSNAAQDSAPDGLPSRGVTFEVSTTADWSKNFRGGVSTQGSAARHLTRLVTKVDTEKFLGWRGGAIYLDLQQHAGRPGSLMVGDAQGFSNIDAPRRTHAGEFWFEQTLGDGRLRMKAGKIDANTEFAFVENGADFLNSSMGYTPTILVMPTYPDARLGFNAFLVPSHKFYAGLGVYDADGKGFMAIGEAGTQWKLGQPKLPGRVGLGFWHHTGPWERFEGGSQHGTSGFFLVLDQTLWRERPDVPEDPQGIGVFFQFGTADADVSELAGHTGGGVRWTGALPGRDQDVIGLGATRVRFTDQPAAGFDKPSELAVEAFYKVQITPWLSLTPDVQYIRSPGGVGAQKNALVGTVRVAVDVGRMATWSRRAASKIFP